MPERAAKHGLTRTLYAAWCALSHTVRFLLGNFARRVAQTPRVRERSRFFVQTEQ
jgi:hypothetical protein